MAKTKLITNEIIKLVNSVKDGNPKITKYKIDPYNKFRIGMVDVTLIKGQQPIMNISENYTKEYSLIWRNDVGRVLMNELKNLDPELYELKTSTFKALLKLISDEQYEDFKEKDFDHVCIGDNHYTIIKAVSNKKSYADMMDDYVFDQEEEIPTPKQETDEADDTEEPISANSVALF